MNKFKRFLVVFLKVEKKAKENLGNWIEKRTDLYIKKRFKGQEISAEDRKEIQKEFLLNTSIILIIIFFLIFSAFLGVF